MEYLFIAARCIKEGEKLPVFTYVLCPDREVFVRTGASAAFSKTGTDHAMRCKQGPH